MTRPQIEIDWKLVDDFLIAGSPGTEVAAFFSMHHDTFYRRVEEKYNMGFTAYAQQKKSTGEAMIRKQQLNKALGLTKEGDNTLLIWLGKQRLNQSETPKENAISEDTIKKYDAIINQLDALQSSSRERNMESNNNNTDSSS